VNITQAKSEIGRNMFPSAGSGYLDQVVYRSVHFHGIRAADALANAAQYLREFEARTHWSPHTLCIHVQFSYEDNGSDLAWQVTIVFSETTPGP
jgi:hypothetical protein